MRFKRKLVLGTLCHGKGRLSSSRNFASTTQLCPEMRPFSTPNPHFLFTSGEKSGLGRASGPRAPSPTSPTTAAKNIRFWAVQIIGPLPKQIQALARAGEEGFLGSSRTARWAVPLLSSLATFRRKKSEENSVICGVGVSSLCYKMQLGVRRKI